jgi:hypothetical protein
MEGVLLGQLSFASSGDRSSRAPPAGMHDANPQENEDLPYKVELWDAHKQAVEQVLAVTANSSIGYAAYHAATRDYVNRYVTLSHKGVVLIRWNSPIN